MASNGCSVAGTRALLQKRLPVRGTCDRRRSHSWGSGRGTWLLQTPNMRLVTTWVCFIRCVQGAEVKFIPCSANQIFSSSGP